MQLWDNVSTNDYDTTRCFLGPLELRAPSLLLDSYNERTLANRKDGDDECGVVRGLLLNNAVDAALFDVPLMSLAYFVHSPRHYSAAELLTPLLERWRADENGALGLTLAETRLLVDVCKTPFDIGVTVAQLSSRIDRLLNSVDGDNESTLKSALAALDSLDSLYEHTMACRNRALASALHAVLWPLKEGLISTLI